MRLSSSVRAHTSPNPTADRATAHTTPAGRTSPACPKRSSTPTVSITSPPVRSADGARGVRVDGAGLAGGDQHPPRQVQREAEAVGEGQHHQGQAHDHRVDAEVRPDAARHPRQHPIVVGPHQPVGQAERALVEAEAAGHGLPMIPRPSGSGHRERH